MCSSGKKSVHRSVVIPFHPAPFIYRSEVWHDIGGGNGLAKRFAPATHSSSSRNAVSKVVSWKTKWEDEHGMVHVGKGTDKKG